MRRAGNMRDANGARCMMAISLEALGIDRMSIEDQLELVQAIWDNIASSNARLPIGDALRADLDRHLDDHLAKPEDIVSWEEVRTAALARITR